MYALGIFIVALHDVDYSCRTAFLYSHNFFSTPTKTNKALKSPPSHRAKKFTSSHVTKTRTEISTDSSSEGIDKKKSDRNKMMPSHGNFGRRCS